MKKLFITVIGLFVLLYGILIFICLHVLLKDTDDYLDNDKASLEMVSYGGEEDTFEYAVMTCDYNKVQEYLDKKTDVNQLLKESQKTPLMLAATLPEYEDVMKMSKLLKIYYKSKFFCYFASIIRSLANFSPLASSNFCRRSAT